MGVLLPRSRQHLSTPSRVEIEENLPSNENEFEHPPAMLPNNEHTALVIYRVGTPACNLCQNAGAAYGT